MPPTTTPARILITGGAGFIGSHLCDLMLKQGHHVHAFDDLSTGSQSNIDHLADHARLTFTRGSVLDRDALAAAAGHAQIIIHLAAAVGVRLVIDQPVRTIQTNIAGTEAVLDLARDLHARILIASSSEVYGKSEAVPFREDDDVTLGPTVKPRWSYAATKMVDEFLAFAYRRTYDLDVTVFRLFNTVGPRQRGQYGMVIPRFVRQALGGEPITVFGDGSQRRCFCDVRDACRAIALLAACPHAIGRVYNVGSTEEVTIMDLARRVKAAAASDSPIQTIPYDQAYMPGFDDMHRRVPDLSRIAADTGWTPTRSLDNILAAVIEHERATHHIAPE